MIHQHRVDSRDHYFASERSIYENPESDTRGLLDHYNGTTIAGRREIYEVMI